MRSLAAGLIRAVGGNILAACWSAFTKKPRCDLLEGSAPDFQIRSNENFTKSYGRSQRKSVHLRPSRKRASALIGFSQCWLQESVTRNGRPTIISGSPGFWDCSRIAIPVRVLSQRKQKPPQSHRIRQNVAGGGAL